MSTPTGELWAERIAMNWKPKSDYAKKLEHPKWQLKRLEIMKRDGMVCRSCGESEQQLQVHHRYYVSGRDPWEYPDWSLVTLCKCCHGREKLAQEDRHPNTHREWEAMVGFLMCDTDDNVAWEFMVSMHMAARAQGMTAAEYMRHLTDSVFQPIANTQCQAD
jgi:hypothetical protein